LANEAFHALLTKKLTPTHHLPDGRTTYAFASDKYVKLAPTSAFPPSCLTAPLHPGIPMDIDAQCAKVSTPHTCHCCGSPNHLICNFPWCFDIRHMYTEEIDDFLANNLARRDALASGSTSEGSETGVTVVERKATEEDFV
jgi:hypothetical protein